MKQKNLNSIRIKHINDVKGIEEQVFKMKLEKLNKKKYLGFIEERTYTTPKGKIIIESFLIKGTFEDYNNKSNKGIKVPTFD